MVVTLGRHIGADGRHQQNVLAAGAVSVALRYAAEFVPAHGQPLTRAGYEVSRLTTDSRASFEQRITKS